MITQVNEFGVLGISTVPPVGANPMSFDISMSAPDEAQVTPDEAVPAPVSPITSVYVVSTDIVNGYGDNTDILIDMVLSVNVNDADCYRTYKVIKRLALNRDKLAAEAMNCEVIRVEEKLSESQQEIKRLRALIGR